MVVVIVDVVSIELLVDSVEVLDAELVELVPVEVGVSVELAEVVQLVDVVVSVVDVSVAGTDEVVDIDALVVASEIEVVLEADDSGEEVASACIVLGLGVRAMVGQFAAAVSVTQVVIQA